MDWLKSIKKGKSREIAKKIFLEHTTQEKVTKSFPEYNRKKFGKGKNKHKKIIHYVEPIVNHNFKIWEEEKFLTESSPVLIRDRWERVHKVFWRIMNLNPLFKYCETKNIIFDSKEKDYLTKLFSSEEIRKRILEEYPDRDIIEATLKFYLRILFLDTLLT